MAASDVILKLTRSDVPLADTLRELSILPEVRSDQTLSDWVRLELEGYEPNGHGYPPYRIQQWTVRGSASNLAWQHPNVLVPIESFSATAQELRLPG